MATTLEMQDEAHGAFSHCRTPEEVNTTYKSLYRQFAEGLSLSDALNMSINILSEPYRKAMTPFTEGNRLAANGASKESHLIAHLQEGDGYATVPMVSSSQIRAWAQDNGIVVGKRGRLHPDVITAWKKAHEGSSAND